MRVAFFDTDAEELTNYRKGKLFESLPRRLVGGCPDRRGTLLAILTG
jgi:hypothetical protein